MKSTGEVASSI